jgi:hypothetical protein
MRDLNWVHMLDVLSGEKFTNYGLQQIAEINIGKIVSTNQYLKLTERLYEPSSTERFAAM